MPRKPKFDSHAHDMCLNVNKHNNIKFLKSKSNFPWILSNFYSDVNSNSSLTRTNFIFLSLVKFTQFLRRGLANLKTSEHSTLACRELGFIFRQEQFNRYIIGIYNICKRNTSR
jgi:hypothetical protein